MGILDRFKKSADRPLEPELLDPPSDPAVSIDDAPSEIIPRVDVYRGTMEPDPSDPKHGSRIPESLIPLEGPLGPEMPHLIMSEGFRSGMKNVRAGTELELTMGLKKPEIIYPQILVYRGDQCLGLLEIYRAEWFAPVVRLAEQYGVAMTMGGTAVQDLLRVEPYIYLPDPQKLYDMVRETLLSKISLESRA